MAHKPSRWLYLLAMLIIAAGATAFALLEVRPFHGMQRLMMPGMQTVEVTQTGTYMIFYEYEGNLNGTTYSAPQDPVAVRLTVINASTGQQVPTTAVSHNLSKYSLLSRSGVSLIRFEAAQPGNYQITAAYPSGQSGPAFALAVAQGRFGGLLGNTLVGVLVFVVSLLAGIGLALLVFVKRHEEAIRRLQQFISSGWGTGRANSRTRSEV